jgi:hypothetical protein
MASWKPGSARERITDPKIAFLRRFEKLSEEEQNKYIEELMAKIKRA